MGLVSGDRVRPGAGAAGGPAHAHRLQGGNELRAVRGLACGQDERQRAEPAVGGDVDLAGPPSSEASEEGGIQVDSVSAWEASSFFPRAIPSALLSALFFVAAPFDLALSCSAAAGIRRFVSPSPERRIYRPATHVPNLVSEGQDSVHGAHRISIPFANCELFQQLVADAQCDLVTLI